MRTLLLAALLLIPCVASAAEDLPPSAFTIIGAPPRVIQVPAPTRKYPTYDEGLAQAKEQGRGLMAVRKVRDIDIKADMAARAGLVFCVAEDNDSRVPEGVTEYVFAKPVPVAVAAPAAPSPPQLQPQVAVATPPPPKPVVTFNHLYNASLENSVDLVAWVGVTCVPCEKKLSSAYHLRCQEFEGDSTPRVVVNRVHNGKMYKAREFPGIPSVDEIRAVLNLPIYVVGANVYCGSPPQTQQAYYGGSGSCAGGSCGFGAGGGCSSGSCGAGFSGMSMGGGCSSGNCGGGAQFGGFGGFGGGMRMGGGGMSCSGGG